MVSHAHLGLAKLKNSIVFEELPVLVWDSMMINPVVFQT